MICLRQGSLVSHSTSDFSEGVVEVGIRLPDHRPDSLVACCDVTQLMGERVECFYHDVTDSFVQLCSLLAVLLAGQSFSRCVERLELLQFDRESLDICLCFQRVNTERFLYLAPLCKDGWFDLVRARNFFLGPAKHP